MPATRLRARCAGPAEALEARDETERLAVAREVAFAALIRAQKALDKIEAANEDQAIGIKILSRSIEEPLRQIVANTGEDAASVAGLLLTTEVMVAESPKDEEHKHPMPDMGGMGM